MVECDLAKVEVAGSNPVSRSIFLWRHSQVVRQRSAKPPFSGSNPDAASKPHQSLILRHKSPFFYFLIPNRLNLNPLDPEVVS